MTPMMLRCLIALLCLNTVLVFGLPVSAKVFDDQPTTHPQGLPTVDEILKRHIEAVGGEDAIRRHMHRTQSGVVRIPALDIEGTFKITRSVPNLFLMESDLGRHGINRTGYDGEVGWTSDEINGHALLRDASLHELHRQADFQADLNVTQHFDNIQVLGRHMFHDVETYELKMVDRNGKDVFAYFSTDSGRQVGLKGMFESAVGPLPVETLMSEYESFDGVFLPTVYETHFRDIVQHMKIEKVSHERVDESVFEVPPAIRTLLEQQEAKDSEP